MPVPLSPAAARSDRIRAAYVPRLSSRRPLRPSGPTARFLTLVSAYTISFIEVGSVTQWAAALSKIKAAMRRMYLAWRYTRHIAHAHDPDCDRYRVGCRA